MYLTHKPSHLPMNSNFLALSSSPDEQQLPCPLFFSLDVLSCWLVYLAQGLKQYPPPPTPTLYFLAANKI